LWPWITTLTLWPRWADWSSFAGRTLLTTWALRTDLALQALRAELRQVHDLRFALPACVADSDEARRFLAQDEGIGRRTGKEERGSKN
jgi:hypothetical protein